MFQRADEGSEEIQTCHEENITRKDSVVGILEELNKQKTKYVNTTSKTWLFIDKTVLYLSAGGIFISVTFLKNIIGEGSVVCLWLIMISWILLAITVLSILLGHLIYANIGERAILTCTEQIKDFTEIFEAYKEDYVDVSDVQQTVDRISDTAKPEQTRIMLLNHVIFITFNAGIITMLIFAILNANNRFS